ncbi:phytoene desaturase family protein [Sphingomonas sp. S1-29]|uniref:1-hydroxycarotenoid 3,4-desaturase CrtD n=1 Tax=Sphingomonas sp. S1-29 TaxID=2991074 RepID=UPI00223F1CB1|nr:1-hydroxycarotenoid 3,4-desaturase CrtD [Sphingomonas sp. S1-29]UZK69533.1 phytoene desaturase family protein [Sphingomonas sp. S1-29]
MPRDHMVIIGAGIGGLVAAALLGARGHAVTVVEAQPGPGGKLRAIDVAGDAIDAGPTVFTLREVFADIFAACGSAIEDHLTLRPATVLARHAWGDDRLDLFADPARSEAGIGDFAGATAARGYRAFRTESARIFDALDPAFMRRTRSDPLTLTARLAMRRPADAFALRPYESLWSALGGHFADPRLRQLFGRYATYCGSSPFACPATLMLVAHVEARGVWMIEGGMHRLALALEALAKANGARFRYGAPVSDITIERGRASGVTLASGEHIAAASVLCNADPAAIAEGRFGEDARRAVAAYPPKHRSLGAMVWLAKAKPSGFPLARHNVLFSPDYPAEFRSLAASRLAADPSVYVCAQDRNDAGHAPAGPERFQIIVNAPPTGDTHPLTPQEIETCTQAMHRRLSQAGLSLDSAAGETRLLTPTDFEALCPSTGGALYGRASHGWAASFLRQGSRTRIPGLYCAGGSCHPGAGLPMAALSASLAVDCLAADRASTSWFRRRAMPGGISTRPAMTAGTG